MLAVDASFALELCLDRVGDEARVRLREDKLIAPPLLWSEVASVLHELAFRGEVTQALADDGLRALIDNTIAVERVCPEELTETAWRISTSLGWAKTYDAEYLAVAMLCDCRLVTIDARLRRGADRLGFVVGPDEL